MERIERQEVSNKVHIHCLILITLLYKTLWMRENLKNYQAFDHNLLSLLCVCVCVFVGGAVCSV